MIASFEIIAPEESLEHRRKERRRKKQIDPYTKREGMNFCPKCKHVWEMWAVKYWTNYYKGFPVLGKPEEPCPKCQPKNFRSMSYINQERG